MDSATKRWIRNASDERAAAAGCFFDEAAGQHVIDFAAKYLKLYEGECAGQPLVAADWQIEATMRLFGWMKPSERWGRNVRRFRRAGIWLPKKSGKSPTLAWWAIYLLVADGEQGQKVYLAAKDGTQARDIAGKHVVEMVNASDHLRRVCSINKSLLQVTHEPSRSILKPISSSDSKAQKAKEGLNGSVMIDETHVVDREFVARISRAGISRSEPMHIEVSTAGNDPESYGKEMFDYGARVAEGTVQDESFFYLAYAAPQDLTDADLAADPVKWGKMANPAWGRLNGGEEYIDDYNRSRRSISELADFKMYRLNVWQATSNPWLRMNYWNANRRDYKAEDLLGRDCYGGLDLAKTRDTTSLSLVFPEDDGTYKLLVYYWLPEARAHELSKEIGYLEWAAQGWIKLTPGNVCDYGFVRAEINAIRERFNLLKVGFDGTYAAQLMQRLAEEDGMDLTAQEKIPQTIMNFAGPMAAMERMVTDGTLLHNGNPLLTWQAGNTCVYRDANENMRPVKDKGGSKRTIDGVVASMMALAMAQKYHGTMGTGGVEVW